jgi:hypothetical protein
MVKYVVYYNYCKEVVEVEEETTDYGAILDMAIDQIEARGETGYFLEWTETVEDGNMEGYYADEYVVGGNHGLLLYHAGNFRIEKEEN